MWLRVSALVMRYLYLYRRSLARAGEVFFWPVMDLVLWGFLTAYMERFAAPRAVVFLIGAMIFWDVLYRSQQAITLSLAEEIWVRNILNIFLAPLRTVEIAIATCLMGVIKAALTLVVLGTLAHVFFAFDILALGPALVPFVVSLLLFGWAVGMCTMGLVIRFGQSAEALIWGVPFLLQPFSAVFYPVSVLPGWLQKVAALLPSTYVFEGMRNTLATGRPDVARLAASFAMDAVYLVLAGAFLTWMLHLARVRGYLTRLGME